MKKGRIVLAVRSFFIVIIKKSFIFVPRILKKIKTMGIYLNPNSVLLKEALLSEIFIDKSLIIRDLISSYYGKNTDSLPLYEKLKIFKDYSFQKYYGKYNVIKLDINGLCRNIKKKSDLVNNLNKKVVSEIKEQFPSAKVLFQVPPKHPLTRVRD